LYSIGLDFGTNSVRCLVVDVSDGTELSCVSHQYPSGDQGVLLDHADDKLARQNPVDYHKCTENVVQNALREALNIESVFDPSRVIGIGVDSTCSTPIPVTRDFTPLCFLPEFKDNLNAYAWLWKDHTSFAESEEITELARKEYPEYLAWCGGTYPSEFYYSKLLHCLRIDPVVFEAAFSWIELCDYIPVMLGGLTRQKDIKNSRCAAGHKAMFADKWGGLPSKEFLTKLDPRLRDFRGRLYSKTYTCDTIAARLSEYWAQKLGLPLNIPIAVGSIDAHLGTVGAGIAPGKMVKIIGTSMADMMVLPPGEIPPDIPGIQGIVDGSILPGHFAIEAGQSGVGDIFNWFVNTIQPGGKAKSTHQKLTQKALKLKPGQSGLLALDWNNGNRNVLVDQRLTGLILGQTLQTKPEEIYRALIESTVFGALKIIDRFEEYGQKVKEIIAGGGIAYNNALFMQICADVTDRELKLPVSSRICAFGSAMAGAVVAVKNAGGYDSFSEAQAAMCRMMDKTYKPNPENRKVYSQLYRLYNQLHDAFGRTSWKGQMANVMKDLLEIKDNV
jgi:L-ribulokinase